MGTEEEECDTQGLLSYFFFSVLLFSVSDKGENFGIRRIFFKSKFERKNAKDINFYYELNFAL